MAGSKGTSGLQNPSPSACIRIRPFQRKLHLLKASSNKPLALLAACSLNAMSQNRQPTWLPHCPTCTVMSSRGIACNTSQLPGTPTVPRPSSLPLAGPSFT